MLGRCTRTCDDQGDDDGGMVIRMIPPINRMDYIVRGEDIQGEPSTCNKAPHHVETGQVEEVVHLDQDLVLPAEQALQVLDHLSSLGDHPHLKKNKREKVENRLLPKQKYIKGKEKALTSMPSPRSPPSILRLRPTNLLCSFHNAPSGKITPRGRP